MLESLADPERARAMNQRDHAQAAKVAHEIASLLDGQATSRIERRGDPEENQRAADLLRGLGAMARPISAEEVAGSREALDGAPAALVGMGAGAVRDVQSRDADTQGAAVQGVAQGDSASYTRSDTADVRDGLEGGRG
jgi:hypothetical protein